jgi:pimeloyl-ACP methyl ester carboxylesterase
MGHLELPRATRFGDLVLDVRTWGPDDGVPVVLLHGFPQSAASWEPVAEHLAGSGLRLVAPDQRGYSARARPDDVAAYTIEELAGDVLALVDTLVDTLVDPQGDDRVHLVGHDWGASVAWWVAAHHPERLHSLTALSVPHLAAFGRALVTDPEQRERSAYLKLFRRPGVAEEQLLADGEAGLRAVYAGRVPQEAVERDVTLMREGALAPALGWYRAMTDMSGLPDVRVPTTFVWGEDDQATAPAAAHGCADHVDADYRFVPLEGVSHWSLDEVPELVASEVRRRVGTPGG